MPITIHRPQPAAPPRSRHGHYDAASDSDSDSSGGGADLEGDISMRAPKRRRASNDDDDYYDEILTPGTVITSNPQWMRYVLSEILSCLIDYILTLQ